MYKKYGRYITKNVGQLEVSASKKPTRDDCRACYLSRDQFSVFRDTAICSSFLACRYCPSGHLDVETSSLLYSDTQVARLAP